MTFDCSATLHDQVVAIAGSTRPRGRRKHGDCVGGKRAPEYITWRNMLKRCHNENDTAYDNYGGRGIRVCKRWRESYAAFLADMGRKPSSCHSIDRIRVNRGYYPTNCRWADAVTQANNKRRKPRYKDSTWQQHGGKW